MRRSRRSVKEALDAATRAGRSRGPRRNSRQVVVGARPMRVRIGIDPAGFNKLADDLEVDAVLSKVVRRRKR